MIISNRENRSDDKEEQTMKMIKKRREKAK